LAYAYLVVFTFFVRDMLHVLVLKIVFIGLKVNLSTLQHEVTLERDIIQIQLIGSEQLSRIAEIHMSPVLHHVLYSAKYAVLFWIEVGRLQFFVHFKIVRLALYHRLFLAVLKTVLVIVAYNIVLRVE